MPSRSSGHVAVGSVSALLGACGVLMGVARPEWLGGGLLGTPTWALFLTGGCVLLLAGALILVFTFRDASQEPAPVPAYVAFNSRMAAPEVLPPLPTPRPAVAAPPAPLPHPQPLAQGRVPPPREDTAALDAQIRELTRRINKAGVMLATGQLSQQGYLAFVEDLKRQRGHLEAQKVRAELRNH